MPQTAELKKQEVKKLVSDTLAQLTEIFKNSGMSEDDKVGQITNLVTKLNEQIDGKIDEAVGQQTVTVAPGQIQQQQADDAEDIPLEPIPVATKTRTRSRDFGDKAKLFVGKTWAEIQSWFSDPENQRRWDEDTANSVAGVRGSEIFRDVAIKHAKKKHDKLPGGAGDDVDYDELNKKQLDMGEKVEMEHTDSPEIAREIAGDHLAEQMNEEGKDKDEQDYYDKLKTIVKHDHADDDKTEKPAFWRRNLDYGAPK